MASDQCQRQRRATATKWLQPELSILVCGAYGPYRPTPSFSLSCSLFVLLKSEKDRASKSDLLRLVPCGAVLRPIQGPLWGSKNTSALLPAKEAKVQFLQTAAKSAKFVEICKRRLNQLGESILGLNQKKCELSLIFRERLM